MKKSELEQIVKMSNLEYEILNDKNTIMNIWPSYKNDKLKIGNKYYSDQVLGKEEVTSLNLKFESLIPSLIKNKIIVRLVSIMSNGVISNLVLELKHGHNKFDSDFEIDTDFFDHIAYSKIIPTDIGYKYSHPETIRESQTLFDYTLKPHEIKMVIKNLSEIFKAFSYSSDNKNIEWMNNFLIFQNNIEPFKFAIENNIMSVETIIDELCNDASIQYENDEMYQKLFRYLSKFKTGSLEIFHDNIYANYYIKILISSSLTYKNVLKNWEFKFLSGQRLLTYLVQYDYQKEFKQFVNIKDSFRHHFVNWDMLIQPLLKNDMLTDINFFNKLIKNNWLDFSLIDEDYLINFLYNQLNLINRNVYINIMYEFMKHFDNKHEQLLKKLFDKFDTDDIHESIARDIIENFLINSNLNEVSSFKCNDAAIMKYLSEDNKLRKKLLSDPDFINYLIEKDKVQYLPTEIQDVFLF